MINEGQIHYCVLKKAVKADEIAFDSKAKVWRRHPRIIIFYTFTYFKLQNFKLFCFLLESEFMAQELYETADKFILCDKMSLFI